MGTENVRVGIGVIVVKGRKCLMGRRKGSHAAGKMSFPGGHLDFGETWEECSLREVREECGEKFKVRLRRLTDNQPAYFITNDVMKEYGKHYVTIFMVADWIEGEPENIEKEKCEYWDWYDYEQLVALPEDQKADWIPLDLITEFRTVIFPEERTIAADRRGQEELDKLLILEQKYLRLLRFWFLHITQTKTVHAELVKQCRKVSAIIEHMPVSEGMKDRLIPNLFRAESKLVQKWDEEERRKRNSYGN